MDPLPILQKLVAIPSVNPMGHNVTGPEYLEGRVSDYLESLLREQGVPYERIEVVPARDNVIARYDAGPGRPTILLDAHQDTVPVTGMTIDPFGAEVRGGRLYGRGACDVKGGLAAMLAAIIRLHKERPANAANVLLSCTCDEEQTAAGALHLAAMWSGQIDRKSPLVTGPPDLAIAAEPTELHIVVAHKGASRWKIRTTGRACHSSRPQEGVNAVYKMATILTALSKFADQLVTSQPQHPLCGGPTLSVGRIEGGLSVNTVPDECLIEIDRRVVPGEDGEQTVRDVENYLREHVGNDFEMLPPWLVGMTLSDHNNHDWADKLLPVIAEVAGPRTKMGVPYGTNASRFSATGVPSFVFGPGNILQAHTVDEWIDIEELRQGAEIYYRFCANAGAV